MAIRTIRVAIALIGIISLAGCASMGTSNVSVSSLTTPLAVAPEQSLPRIGAPTQIPEGSDFSTAVAMLAQTEGTGIVAVNPGKSADTLALVDDVQKPPKKRPGTKRAPKHIAPPVRHEAEAAPLPAPRPVCTDGSIDPRCPPPVTPWGQPVVPVKRF